MSSTKEWTSIFNIPVIMVRFSIPNSKKSKYLWYPQMTFQTTWKLAFSTVFLGKSFVFSHTILNPVKRSENNKNEIRIKLIQIQRSSDYGKILNSKFQKNQNTYLRYPQMTWKLVFSTVFSEILLYVFSHTKLNPVKVKRSENNKNEIRIKFIHRLTSETRVEYWFTLVSSMFSRSSRVYLVIFPNIKIP